MSPEEDKSRMIGKRPPSYQQAMNEAVPRIGHRQSSYQKAIGSPNEEVAPKIGHRQSSYQRAIGEYSVNARPTPFRLITMHRLQKG